MRHGPWTKWRNGRKVEETWYRDGKRHGLSLGWHENGRKDCEIRYTRGVDRSVECWNEAGLPMHKVRKDAQGNYLGRMVYHPNGTKRAEETWEAGERTGLQRTWWPNGQLASEGNEQNGRRTGTWRKWTPDGRLAEVERVGAYGETERETSAVYAEPGPDWAPDPILRGDARAPSGPPVCPSGSRRVIRPLTIGLGAALAPLSERGIEPELRAELDQQRLSAGRLEACERGGVLEGAGAWYVGRRRLADGVYVEGRREGAWTFWDENGRRAEEVLFRAGRKLRVVEWDASTGHTVSIEHYDEEERKHGVIATWWPNGARRVLGHRRHGELDGVWIWHYENGFRYHQGEYRSGKQVGVWIDWREGVGEISRRVYRDPSTQPPASRPAGAMRNPQRAP